MFQMRSTTEYDLHSKNFLPQIYDIGMMAWAELDWHGHESHHSVNYTKIIICKTNSGGIMSNPNEDNSVTRNQQTLVHFCCIQSYKNRLC